MAKVVDSSLKAFKIREGDVAGGAGGATRCRGRATGAVVAGRRTWTRGNTGGGRAIPEASDERAFGFIRQVVPSFLVRVREAMPSAMRQAGPGAVVVLVNLVHWGVNVTFAKRKRVRVSEMVAVVFNVMVVDLAGRSAARTVTVDGGVVIKLQRGGFQKGEVGFPRQGSSAVISQLRCCVADDAKFSDRGNGIFQHGAEHSSGKCVCTDAGVKSALIEPVQDVGVGGDCRFTEWM